MTESKPRIRVGVAEWRALDGDGTLVTSGLGSCVAVSIYDSDSAVGGLLHAMLPAAAESTGSSVNTPGKYVDRGLAELLADLERRDVSRNSLEAKLVGGSSMLDISIGEAVGERNVEAAKRALSDEGVQLVAEETGGNAGRSVSFSPTTGDVTVERVDAEVLVL
ncbi:chemotaxis protein CheD [Halobacterium zhouii]|uniref:chemotaxis protein CheD n=1 Tax=Halobacterium zhouii TaxID=2902624 RepID=UPI001E29ED06|nr:chemotaxis protein CheD [Halobacterium zhouii]